MPLEINDSHGLTHEALLSIDQSTAGLTGSAFFEQLTRSLARALDVSCAFFAELPEGDDDELRTHSCWVDDDWVENFRYESADGPCQAVLEEGELFCAEKLGARYPKGTPYLDGKAESYLGIRVTGSEGQVLGHLGVVDAKPMPELDRSRPILNILASRAGAELERMSATEAQDLSEARFRGLAENLPGVVYAYDQNTATKHRKLIYLGPGAEIIFGPTLVERIKSDIEHLFALVHPDDIDELIQEGEFAANSRRPMNHTFRARVEGGIYRWLEVHARASSEEGGHRTWNGMLFDITERREAEEQLREYSLALEDANQSLQEVTEKAQAATRAKTEFLANMSHEIRTPMTAILGYTDILNERVEDKENRESLEVIREHGNYLLQVINDILDLSTIEAGKLDLKYQRISVFQLLHHIQELVRVRAHEKGLSLTVEYDGPMPAVLRTDPVRLRQILLNLISNAIKFTERGGVRILVRFHNDDVSLPILEFEIRDTGAGMNQEQIGELFEPFTQADASAGRKHGGTGLGLSISKRLAEMLGGTITVESWEGKGSRFRVLVGTGLMDDLKLVSAEEGLAFLNIPEELPLGPERLNLRILLAEDNRTNQRLIRRILEKLGAWVGIVENGREAVDAALAAAGRGEMYDAVLMDIQMPGMDGLEATRELRAQGYAGPIIALTAHAMEMDRQACLDAGCDDHCTKPVDRHKLVAAILGQIGAERI